MDQDQLYYEIYRGTSIGFALADAIDELVTSGQIKPDLAMQVMRNFDKSIALVLNEYAKAVMSFKGRLDTYKNNDEVWMWVVDDVRFKKMEGDEEVRCGKLKIVACRSKKAVGK